MRVANSDARLPSSGRDINLYTSAIIRVHLCFIARCILKKFFIIIYSVCIIFTGGLVRAEDISDEELLETVSRKAFEYFWYECNPDNGLVYDSMTNRSISNASVGFGLASICVADYRKWITHEEAYDRVMLMLNSLYKDPSDPKDFCVDNVRGHFYHWTDAVTGKWTGAEGICTHDTIACLCGVFVVRKYFEGTEIEKLATKILNNVDWNWNAERSRNKTFVSNLYSPNNHDWGWVMEYDGLKLDYLLPIGATQRATDPKYWHNWAGSYQWGDYNGHFHHIKRAAIWIHQWDNCYVDFRYLRDKYADYHQNSVEATLANRQWCIDNKSYDENCWGLNPTDGPGPGGGSIYGDYGAPPAPSWSYQQGHVQDGTIAFTAAAPSIIFTPKESIAVLRYMWENLKDKMWGKYGFTCSFNLKKNWYSKNYIGIDLGTVVLNIENYRSGLIQKTFMKNEEVQRALDLTGFVGIIDNFDPSEHSQAYAEWSDPGNGENYRFKIINRTKVELGHAMQVNYRNTDNGDKYLVVDPLREDFSFYKYAGIWAQGAGDIKVVFNDGKKTAVLEKFNKSSNSGSPRGEAGWELYYYKIPQGTIDTKNIKDIRIYVLPGQGKKYGVCYFDFMHITNNPIKAPQAAQRFRK